MCLPRWLAQRLQGALDEVGGGCFRNTQLDGGSVRAGLSER